MSVTAIGSYGMIGDLHTAALVGTDGSIDWLCMPRFDAGACFAALLGDDEAGFWKIAPAHARTSSLRYLESTMILQTDWDTEDGRLRVTDFMPPRDGAVNLVRIAECLSGKTEVDMAMRIRFDYGHMLPWVRHDDRCAHAIAGPHAMRLDTTVTLDGDNDETRAHFTLAEGESARFVLTYVPSHHDEPEPVDPTAALHDTERLWNDWNSSSRLRGPWQSIVERSLLTLKALIYEPTGGLVAAPTTSLPQQSGGGSNRDFRNCRLRDATSAIRAFLCTERVKEAEGWRQWLLRAAAGDPHRLQMTYALDGARHLSEYDVDWLSGYGGGLAPVKVGYDNPKVPALDVWGEVIETLHRCRAAGLGETDASWRLQRAMVNSVMDRWADPDIGPLEEGPPRQFVYSKVMAWVAMECAIKAIEESGLDGPVEQWRRARDDIHASVCQHGYDEQRGVFTRYYGSNDLDAWLLLMPRTGFLPYDDERVVRTIDAVCSDLVRDDFVMPYDRTIEQSAEPRGDAVSVVYTFWLVEALHNLGRADEARARFEHLIQARSQLGLLGEQYDPADGKILGNFPHSHAHSALIDTAYELTST